MHEHVSFVRRYNKNQTTRCILKYPGVIRFFCTWHEFSSLKQKNKFFKLATHSVASSYLVWHVFVERWTKVLYNYRCSLADSTYIWLYRKNTFHIHILSQHNHMKAYVRCLFGAGTNLSENQYIYFTWYVSVFDERQHDQRQ